ncbi:D-alanyl-D-alanine carboxypeptidase [Streptomyces sp. NPDC051217]|uniref:D-alanyl-D-alanine carboxypeptidase n=1 Tax=Streptomyces sp. NPDC051217 TaxID=3365644 RepID=UPI0037AC71C1
MAGESPDKSEQRKSSGEAAQEPDPRFAVFRESAAAREADADATAGEAEGGADTDKDATPGTDGSAVDTAEPSADRGTAVFTVRGERGPSGAPEAAGARVTAPEVPSAPEAGRPEAVSVASEPEGEATPAGPEMPGGAAAAVPEAADSGEVGVDRRTAVFKAVEPEPESTGGPKSGAPAATSEPEAAKRGGAAPAAPVADATTGKPEADRGAGGAAKPAAAPPVPKPDATAARPGDAPAVQAGGSGPTTRGSEGSTAPKARPEPVADATTGKPETGPAAKPAAERDGGGAARPGAASAASAGGSGPTPYPTASKAEAGPAARPAAERDGGARTGADGDDEPGVDRKTAVFKAVKRPGVDQPTAMLKLPPQPPAATPPAVSPELPAERTSKFVPLRADDVRVPAKPAGAPSGQAVAEAERTRQQPMPPLPPLDLLAELTNKPAPPETPTRTVVRRVKIWTPLLVLVLIVFAVVQAVRPLPAPSLNLTTKSTYTFEGDKPALPWPGEGQGFMAATGLGTVDSFGEQKAVPIGSVAKAMTAYVVLQDHPLKKGAKGPSIKVDAKAEEDGGLDAQGESTLNTVKEGDTLTQHDALAALMIPSANNIARLLARWDANGSEEAFVKKMNDTAAELGMKNTEYTDPSGLDATTVSSAEDQVKLGQKLVEIEALMDITKLPEWTDPSGKSWRNYNTLVPYDGALGIKTGSTTKAGGNLLFAAHQMVGDTDQLIVGAVLGQHKSPIIDTVNAVSKGVMLATQDELEGATIVKKGAVVGEVDNGMGTTTPVVATEDVKAVGWSGLTVKLELTDGGEVPPHAAAAGTHIGTLTVGEGKSQVEVAVALQSDVSEPSFTDKLTRVS